MAKRVIPPIFTAHCMPTDGIIADRTSAKRAFMTQQTSKISAPVAPIHPHSFTTHGVTVSDDYAWLKDAKWQEVLRDPSVLEPEIRT